MKRITVLAEGAWGTAIASVLADNGHTVQLWCYHEEVAREIEQFHRNTKYLPSFSLSHLIKPTTDLKKAIENADIIFEAIPVKYLREVLEKVRFTPSADQWWVTLSKGIEHSTLLLPTEIVQDVLGRVPVAALSGPSFADGIMRKQLTCVQVGSADSAVSDQIKLLLANEYFRIQTTDDVRGIQLAGALKNVLTLGMGMLEGAGYADNTKAFFFTRALAQMGMLISAAGGSETTVYDLAGVGDAVLTALGSHSKNLKVGRLLGAGKTLQEILKETGFIPEGIDTARSLRVLVKRLAVSVPLLDVIAKIVHEETSIEELITVLKQTN